MSRQAWGIRGVILGVFLFSMPCWIGQVVVYSLTGSMPRGWYVRTWPRATWQVGDIVTLDVPASMAHQMPSEVPARRLLKQIAAVPGMEVCWERDAMVVVTLGQARAYPLLPERPLARELGCLVLPAHELAVIGTHARSYDSRYVGLIEEGLVQFRVVPVWTWEGAE